MKRYSKEERSMWLEDWRQSGKSAWTYAKGNGLIPQTFINWTKRTKEASKIFIEVPAKAIQDTTPMAEVIIEKGEVKIRIPLMIGRGEFCAVIEALEPLVRGAAQ